MSNFDIDMVCKIGSMALIRKEDNDLDYNIFSRLGSQLSPGIVLVSSGAVEIGRLDYMKRNHDLELLENSEDYKADYSAQGQAILMQNYREFIPPQYSVRQVLVEHQHFNNPQKREHIKDMLLRCVAQNAIPIINYNDPVSVEENRRLELANIKSDRGGNIVECIDNDETAAVISTIVHSRLFVMLTSIDGICEDPNNLKTLIPQITGSNLEEVIANINKCEKFCVGSSRSGSNGAKSKLKFAIEPVKQGTTVIVANAKYKLKDIVNGTVPRTFIGLK